MSFYDGETDGFHKQKSCALAAMAAPGTITFAKKFMAVITFSVQSRYAFDPLVRHRLLELLDTIQIKLDGLLYDSP